MRSAILITTLALVTGSSLARSAQPSTLEQKLQTKVRHYAVDEDTFPQALAKIAAEFEIPMGIVWIKPSQPQPRIELSWADTTVENIIEDLVRSRPGYTFTTANGLVHVFPKTLLADSRNFLNMSVGRFEVQNEFVQFASRKLHTHVHRLVAPSPPPMPGVGYAGSMATGLGDRRISLSLQDVSVQEVLDKLALAADFKFWVVVFTEKRSLTTAGFYATSSLQGGTVRDEDQPFWQLLMWGFDPITMSRRPDWVEPQSMQPLPKR